MTWTASDSETIGNILLGWDKLSAGDISTLHGAVEMPGGCLATTEGSANCTMWENFERLGWARRADLPLPPPSALFEVTEAGRDYIPRFIKQFDLRHGTFYRLTPPPAE